MISLALIGGLAAAKRWGPAYGVVAAALLYVAYGLWTPLGVAATAALLAYARGIADDRLTVYALAVAYAKFLLVPYALGRPIPYYEALWYAAEVNPLWRTYAPLAYLPNEPPPQLALEGTIYAAGASALASRALAERIGKRAVLWPLLAPEPLWFGHFALSLPLVWTAAYFAMRRKPYAALLAAALAVAYAIYGGTRARIALTALALAGAALFTHKLAAAQLAAYAAPPPPAPWDPLWGLVYAFYGPSALLLAAAAAYAALKTKKTVPLALAALIVLAAGLASPQYGERLMRIASLMLPAAAVGGLLEARRDRAAALVLAAYLAGPAAAGWAWATRHLDGLYAYVQRLTPDKLYAYQQALEALPPHSNVQVMWQLDLWLLPLAKAQRPDLNVTAVWCVWTPAQYYIYTPPDPRQWYMPCTLAAGPPPGREIARWGETALYEGTGHS